MNLSLYDDGWKEAFLGNAGVGHFLMFTVEHGSAKFLQLRIDDDLARKVAPRQPRPAMKELTEQVVRFVLKRLAALGPDRVDELLTAVGRYPTYVIIIQDSDLGDLRTERDEKQCRYQALRGGDLFCSVAISPARTPQPVSEPGATTRFMCSGCTLPDVRVACSRLHHPTVLVLPDGAPQVTAARCDIGKDEARQEPAKCRPGGHACWSRTVEFLPRPTAVVSPLALHESFDYFDAVWKNVFQVHVLRPRAAAVW